MKSNILSITIVIPFLNEEDTINDVFHGVDIQTVKPSEVIFVDAGTTDSTVSLINNWSEKQSDISVKVIDAAPAYPGKGRNVGVSHATSNYIAFLDSGIKPNPNWLETLYNSITSDNFDGAWGRSKYIGLRPMHILFAAYSSGQDSFIPHFLAASMFKRSVFDNGHIFREDLRAAEDRLWRNQFFDKFKYIISDDSIVTYTHFPETIIAYYKKWFQYANHNAFANMDHKLQVLYFLYYLSLVVSLYFSNFIPCLLLISYFVVRGILDPMRRSKKKLWFNDHLYLFFIGPFFIFFSDLTKFLGYIRGNFRLVRD